MKLRKKICPKCGKKLWLSDFYRLASGWVSSYCKDCTKAAKREKYAHSKKVPNGLYRDKKGRMIEHRDYSTKISWSKYMEERLTRLYPTTKNEDLTIEFNVSLRTLIRKARELHLQKNREWMHEMSIQNCKTMRVLNICRGNSGQFKKGEHRSPETEFKKKAIC